MWTFMGFPQGKKHIYVPKVYAQRYPNVHDHIHNNHPRSEVDWTSTSRKPLVEMTALEPEGGGGGTGEWWRGGGSSS